ncbi:MAG: hypothetical protein PHZ18_05965, partial [Methanoculleus sp.]|uniref:hypothetical protein n=1 Tax=Methanoculleus sp. TaxID=90427 RepID=UPI00261A469A
MERRVWRRKSIDRKDPSIAESGLIFIGNVYETPGGLQVQPMKILERISISRGRFYPTIPGKWTAGTIAPA